MPDRNRQYYRNNIDLQNQYETIEADSLWYKKGDVMILEDEDRHVEWPYNPIIFREVTL